MQWQMKWKSLLLCISAVIFIILLIKAATVQPKKVSTESYAQARAQPEMDQLMCPKAVEATLGGNVTLDFHFKSQLDVTGHIIEWKFNKSIYVLVYRSRGVSDIQDVRFKSRASLESIENISKGKLAVKISSLKKMDAGTYSCFVTRGEKIRSCSVELIISAERVGHVKAAAPNRSGTTYALVLAASTLLYLLYD